MLSLTVILLEKKKTTFVGRVRDTNAVLEFFPMESMKEIPDGHFCVDLLTDVQHGSNRATSHVFACSVRRPGAHAVRPSPPPRRQRPTWNAA